MMSSILKKLMACAMLLIAAGQINAQIKGHAPVQKVNPGIPRQAGKLHSYSWHKTDFLKRYPQYSARVAQPAPLSVGRTRQTPPGFEQLRQDLFQRYPHLQQRALQNAQSRTLSAVHTRPSAQRSLDFYRALTQEQVERARTQMEQIRQRNPEMQQSPQ